MRSRFSCATISTVGLVLDPTIFVISPPTYFASQGKQFNLRNSLTVTLFCAMCDVSHLRWDLSCWLVSDPQSSLSLHSAACSYCPFHLQHSTVVQSSILYAEFKTPWHPPIRIPLCWSIRFWTCFGKRTTDHNSVIRTYNLMKEVALESHWRALCFHLGLKNFLALWNFS